MIDLKTKDGKVITKENIENTIKSLKWCSFNLGRLDKDLEPNTFPYALKVYIENAIELLESYEERGY